MAQNVSTLGLWTPPELPFQEFRTLSLVVEAQRCVRDREASITAHTIPTTLPEQTHTAYYNVIGRRVDARLAELGGRRIVPLGLGDDSGCIELDWEAWQGQLLAALATESTTGAAPVSLSAAANRRETPPAAPSVTPLARVEAE